MNEPAALPVFPDVHTVHTVAPNVLSSRDLESKCAESRLRIQKQSSSKPKSPLRLVTEESRHGVDIEPPDRLNGSLSPLVVQTTVVADPRFLIHFPANVIEDMLPG